MKSTIIFVSGHPATGKTTLARKLAEELSLPFFSKDLTLKEPMFDAFETTSREWSIKVGKASYKILEQLIEQQVKAGYSLVVESVFRPKYDNPTFQELQNKYGFDSVQIRCYGETGVLAKRFMERVEKGERHSGHGEVPDLEGVLQEFFAEEPTFLAIKGKTVELDATDFMAVDSGAIIADVKKYLTR